MNKEQNINDILELLRDSVTSTAATENFDALKRSDNDISVDTLQEQLKNQYATDTASVPLQKSSSDEYIIDNDFLSEVEQAPRQSQPTEDTHELVIEQVEIEFEKPVEIDEAAEVEEHEEIELPPIIEIVPEIEEVLQEDYEPEIIELQKIEIDGGPEDDVGEDIKEQELEEAEQPKSQAAPEPHETFLASMRKIGMDFTTDEIYKNSLQNNENTDVTYSEGKALEEAPIINEPLDPSTVNLMMQFCEKEELEETIGDKNVDDFLRLEQSTLEQTAPEPLTDGKEYSDVSQNDEIKERYKKQCKSKLVKLLTCIGVMLIAFIYELLPLLDVRLSGTLDYHTYPAIYTLLGLQFIVFAAAIWYKEFWRGLKRAFSAAPTYESLAAIILLLTAFYDLIMVIIVAISGDELPNMYNAIAVFTLVVVALEDYLSTVCQMKAFEVYSCDQTKYTLNKEGPSSSIGSKMYGGGLESDKSIYSVRRVDFPNGFFRSVNKDKTGSKLLAFMIVPVLVIGLVASVISMILGFEIYEACASFIICMYALMPISLVVVNILPSALVCFKLTKRGSAFAGTVSAEKYSDADIMVFGDLHMFKKCKTEDIGIAVYDTKVGYLTLGCIDALYKKIGGPMSGMQMNLPDVFKFNHVTLKRVAQNGIEAVIDKRHSLVVGAPEFMQRYGLSFPKNETENGRMTLCVSLNGGVTAKLSVKYNTEPIFEMLVERLAKEGITCAIKTLDPLINSSMIANSRTLGDAPISVVHSNARDLACEEKTRYNTHSDGVICCSSRLKIAQAVIMLKRLVKVRKICSGICIGFTALGAASLAMLLVFGAIPYVNQMLLLAFLAIELALITAVMFKFIPENKYFTVDALYSELERKHKGQLKKNKK